MVGLAGWRGGVNVQGISAMSRHGMENGIAGVATTPQLNAEIERLKAELNHAFAAPESSYQPLTAADIIARNKA